MEQASSSQSNESNHGDPVSLQDVQTVTPAESEEETRVLEELEKRNVPVRLSEHEQRLLEVSRRVLLQPQEQEQVLVGEILEPIRGRTATVEEELFAATTSLNRLHYEDVKGAELLPPPVEIFGSPANGIQEEAKEDGEVGQAAAPTPEMSNVDAFAANAGKIYHRFQKKQQRQKSTVDIESGSVRADETKKRFRWRKRSQNQHLALEALTDFRDILTSNKDTTYRYARNQLFFVILPCTGLACLFFYVLEEQPTTSSSGATTAVELNATSIAKSFFDTTADEGNPSISWWILFLGVRQVITFGIATGLQYVLLACSTRMSYGFMGPLLRLFLLQSEGLPLQLMLWAVVDFIALQGPSRFAQHWLFYQDFFEVFNETNPAGTFTSSKYYRGILLFALFAGLAIALKRFFVGLHFGKASYHRYSKKLSWILQKVLLVTKVARLANGRDRLNHSEKKEIAVVDKWFHSRKDSKDSNDMANITHRRKESADVMAAIFSGVDLQTMDSPPRPTLGLQRQATELSMNNLTRSQELKIDELLGEWEDVDLVDTEVENPSLSAIVQFRSSTSVLSSEYSFSLAFGRTRTRADVVEGAQKLYLSLLKHQEAIGDEEGSRLRFHTIALTALREDESFDEAMAKDLVKLFRPSRDGDIELLEFCKSIDTLYKAMRKLRASIENEGRVNAATERFINALFNSFLAIILLGVIGVNTTALIAFLASFVVSTSFMIGGAAADYFRGLLLILVQRPYDIGDRISISSPESEANSGGSSGWIVKDVTLYHTTLIFGTTQEYATISNGYLAKSRIINAARSPRASLFFLMKFGISVSADKVETFKNVVIEYVKSKPREWLSFTAFRMTRFEADLGFIEYKIILEHRESWQQIGALLASLADVQSHAFTVSKEMKMGYQSPSLPVEMHIARGEGNQMIGNFPFD